MIHFPFGRSRGKKGSRKPCGKPSSASPLELQLEEVSGHARELQRRSEEIQARIDDIPKKIRMRQEREQQLRRERAKRARTMRDPGSSHRKLHSVVRGTGMTRSQRRKFTNLVLILCAVLAFMVWMLWKTVR